jgi:hypothetical protein
MAFVEEENTLRSRGFSQRILSVTVLALTALLVTVASTTMHLELPPEISWGFR